MRLTSPLLQLSLAAVVACASTVALPAAYAQDQAGSSTMQPDNTAQNKAHKHTADQQSGATSDRMVTKKIRQSLMQDKALSTYAHNVKIITRDGMVTLKGPVKSDEEKSSIASKAAEVAGGSDKVTNQLTVKQ